MKRNMILLAATVFSTGILLQSCDKIKDKIFDAFTAKGAEVNFTVPPVADTALTQSLGAETVYFNLDSTVRSVTGNAFSLNDVKTVNPDEITITVENPDSANNLSNLESGTLSLSSSSNTTPVNFNFTVPDQYTETFSVPVDKSINLRSYMDGNSFTYTFSGKLRRPTTQDMNCKAVIKFKIDN